MEKDGVAEEYDVRLPQYIREARDLADTLVERCVANQDHFVFLDTDPASDSFDVAHRVSQAPGVVEILRQEAPVKGSKFRARFPDGPNPTVRGS
jgi:hypothetical protein